MSWVGWRTSLAGLVLGSATSSGLVRAPVLQCRTPSRHHLELQDRRDYTQADRAARTCWLGCPGLLFYLAARDAKLSFFPVPSTWPLPPRPHLTSPKVENVLRRFKLIVRLASHGSLGSDSQLESLIRLQSPSYQLDTRQCKPPTEGSRQGARVQYDRTRETRTTPSKVNSAAERRPVRSRQATAVGPCPYYLRSQLKKPEGIPEEQRSNGIDSLP
ncbi:uncharacterized protein TNCV_3416301 [Trichonephila clavipes]|nr:uncharacterized protein TNCV_3416301 [Trichonephila clavipes]